MDRVVVASLLLALVPVVWLLMLRGWRGRLREQAAGLELPVPADDDVVGAYDVLVGAVYVSTTLAGQPFERVLVHQLGQRSAARVAVVPDVVGAPGALVVFRYGPPGFSVPWAEVVGVDRRRGQVGKFVAGRGGLVVVTWRLGGIELDTGLHCRRRADAHALTEAVAAQARGGSGAAA